MVLTDPPVEAARKAIVALPAGDKASGKRPQVDDSEENKSTKKKKKATKRKEKPPIFKDKAASANLLGKCAGHLLPPLGTLLESRKYAFRKGKRVIHFGYLVCFPSCYECGCLPLCFRPLVR